MILISSKKTFFFKKVFPVFWFGFLAVFIAISILDGTYKHDVLFLVGPVLMVIFGVFLMKKMVWDLVDEVYDCGDFLLIKNRGMEDTISLSSIMNVNAPTNTNPPRITLRLVQPGNFGQDVSFVPDGPFTLNPFAKNKIAEDLIVRVDRARSRRM